MQKKSIVIRGVEFGKGIPKICVPIVAGSKADILLQAANVVKKQPDCIELRIDWFEDVEDHGKVLDLLKELRQLIGNTVLLFTLRTFNEGGERVISPEAYRLLNETVCKSGCVDLIDVEAYMQDGLLASICKTAHENGIYVVASNHDFNATPSEEEIVKRLQFMDREGADFPKIAVMPKTERDVLTLLSATFHYRELGGIKPLITMAMGGNGVISRLTGEIFGSAVTFAAGEMSSAPGQIPIDDVRSILNILYEYK